MRRVILLRAAVVIAAMATAALAFTYAYLVFTGHHTIRLADFLAYYTGGKLVLAGHGGSLYSFAAVGHAEAQISFPLRIPGGISPFIYPPWFALAVVPLALLPYTPAYVVWFGANIVFALFSLLTLNRLAGMRGTLAALVTFLGLSFLPVFAAFTQGQVSLLLLALVTGVLWSLRRGHGALAGILLALLLIKPQYALPVAGVLLLRRQWRACGIFALCAVLLVLVPMLVLGSGIEVSYVRGLVHLSALHGNFGYMAPPPVNYSLQGLLGLLVPSHGAVARIGLIGIAFLITVGSALRDRDAAVPIALAVLFGLLASPHVLVYDVSLLIFPVVVLVGRNFSWAPLAAVAYLAPFAGLLLHLSVPFVVTAMGLGMLALLGSTRKSARAGAQVVVGNRPPRIAAT